MSRLVLLDLDNTLIDRDGAVADWVAEFCTTRQLPAEAALHVTSLLRERAVPETFESLQSSLGLAEPPAALWDAYVTGLTARVTCATETLTRLDLLRASGWAVGVLTNGAADIQRAKLASAGILDHVDAVCISEEAGARKPDPEVFRMAAALCGHELPGDAWMVGDDPVTDIAGASTAGLRTIWISAGNTWTNPGLTPDHVAQTAADAAGFLLGLPESAR
ncbi:HAD family hydrolase [Kitasatospora sp. NPDC056181]|uniref:HAD family hydrolase n=1 Tax=Kitasatospora sp. NPDC056181 TaxID=3345737 RepID=UPI0035D64121